MRYFGYKHNVDSPVDSIWMTDDKKEMEKLYWIRNKQGIEQYKHLLTSWRKYQFSSNQIEFEMTEEEVFEELL